MSNFRNGQKVVCIDDGWLSHAHTICPRKGEVYTVREKTFWGTAPGLRFVEITNEPTVYSNMSEPVEPAFLAECFRPVTDISIFEKMLTDCPTGVDAPA